MSAKEVLFGESAHAKLVRGMNVLAEAVRVTLGPTTRARSLASLQNAASIASLILTTDCMIAQLPQPSARPEEMAA